MDKEVIWNALHLVKEECPNQDEGGLCGKYTDCFMCWYTEVGMYLNKFISEEEKQSIFDKLKRK